MTSPRIRNLLATVPAAIAVLAVFAAVAFAATIDGEDKSENLRGTNQPDTINANGGNDKVTARKGADTVNGGLGNDLLFGGFGNDTVDGGDGDDKLHGGHGNDTQNGGAGNDTIYAGRGVDVSNGGDGNDRLWALARADTRKAGVDTLDGGNGDDVFRTRDGEADVITCGEGNDTAFLDRKDVISDATAENANGSCETVKRQRAKRNWKDSNETNNEPTS